MADQKTHQLYVFVLAREPHPAMAVEFFEALELADVAAIGFKCERHHIKKGFVDHLAKDLFPEVNGRLTACPFCINEATGARLVNEAAITPVDPHDTIMQARVLNSMVQARIDHENGGVCRCGHPQAAHTGKPWCEHNNCTCVRFELAPLELVSVPALAIAKLEAKVTQLEKALMATGGRAFESLFEPMGERCGYEDATGEPCQNPPTQLIKMQCPVCDEHANADAFPMGIVQPPHGPQVPQ